MMRQVRRFECGIWRMSAVAAVLLCVLPVVARGQGKGQDNDPRAERARRLFSQIVWQTGPTKTPVGDVAEMKIPADFQYTGRAGAALLLDATGNPPDPTVVGALMPLQASPWFLLFTYDDIGHVSDDEKSQLPGMQESVLKVIRDGTVQGNAYRRGKGLPEVTITGWIIPPKYDESSNNLVWAFGTDSADGKEANYDTRILGRTGVTSVKLVAPAQGIESVIPTVKGLLTDFQYKPGQKYSEVRAGDKIAQYGLTGLITGGVLVAAAKSGLLLKFWKLIVAGVVFVFGGLWRFLTGKTRQTKAQ
jgi:uncharacterized membrane-anchored protein